MSEIEDIKDRIDLVDLAKEFMVLRQAGRNFKAVCPFHQEKTASLMISPDKQIWHCFGCGEGGDIFTLIQKINGLDFYEAMKLLAERAGVELKQQAGHGPERDKKQILYDINRLAAEFYHQSLKVSQSGQLARDYLQKRSLQPAMIDKFKLGFAPNLTGTLGAFLQKRGFKKEDIVAAGLAFIGRQNVLVDKFRLRVMFPIWDNVGKLVGFTGRVLKEADVPKYLNTPTTLIFDKSRLLYGFSFASEEIRRAKEVLICEGQMDVIALYEHGFKNVVCSSGTAFTTWQLKALKRLANSILIAFDKDEAGQKAAYRLTSMALEEGFAVKVIDLGRFKDPDEMVRADRTGFEQALSGAAGFVDYWLESLDKKDKGPKDKSQLADEILPLIVRVPDEVEKGHYISTLADRLGVDESFVFNKYKLKQAESGGSVQPKVEISISLNPEERLAGLLMAFKKVVWPELKDLSREYFSDSIKGVIDLTEKHDEEKFNFDWLTGLTDKEKERWRYVLAVVEQDFPEYDREMIVSEVTQLKTRIKESNRDLLKANLEEQIKQAERNKDRPKVKELVIRLQDLIIKGN